MGPLSMSPSPDPRQVWQRYGGVTIGGGARLPRGAHRRWRGIGVCAGPCLTEALATASHSPHPSPSHPMHRADKLQQEEGCNAVFERPMMERGHPKPTLPTTHTPTH